MILMDMKLIKTESHMARAPMDWAVFRKKCYIHEDSTNERADQLATIQNDRLELEYQTQTYSSSIPDSLPRYTILASQSEQNHHLSTTSIPAALFQELLASPSILRLDSAHALQQHSSLTAVAASTDVSRQLGTRSRHDRQGEI